MRLLSIEKMYEEFSDALVPFENEIRDGALNGLTTQATVDEYIRFWTRRRLDWVCDFFIDDAHVLWVRNNYAFLDVHFPSVDLVPPVPGIFRLRVTSRSTKARRSLHSNYIRTNDFSSIFIMPVCFHNAHGENCSSRC